VVKEHTRKKSNKVIADDNAGESGLRFAPQVRIVEIALVNPATAGLAPSEYEITSYRTTKPREGSLFYHTRCSAGN